MKREARRWTTMAAGGCRGSRSALGRLEMVGIPALQKGDGGYHDRRQRGAIRNRGKKADGASRLEARFRRSALSSGNLRDGSRPARGRRGGMDQGRSRLEIRAHGHPRPHAACHGTRTSRRGRRHHQASACRPQGRWVEPPHLCWGQSIVSKAAWTKPCSSSRRAGTL